MLPSLFKRYGLVICAAMYTAALLALHALGRFPAPGAHDLSRLIGTPSVTLEGRVRSFPQTRWNQTRFLFEGRSQTPTGYRGRALATLSFPVEDLAPGETLR